MRLRNAWFHSFLTAALWALLVCGSVDAAGNMTGEPGRTYQYDAENRIKSVNNGSVAVYQYDADGRRSVKNSASGTRIYFYDIEGRPVAESGPTQGGWLSGHAWFQDRHAFENTGSQFLWRHTDHLGTAVLRTDSNGGKICDSRFYPYGEEFTASCAGDPYKFTGKERDSETGLDSFGARYYGNHYGRFTSVDPLLESGRQEDPQRWNRYAYTRNNPLIYVDPDGKDFVDFLIGVSNGLSSSIAFNLNRIDAQTKNRDFQAGQVVGDALAAGAGVLAVWAGAGGGLTLSATGVGALAGAPAAALSAGVLAYGATTTTVGSRNASLGLSHLLFSRTDDVRTSESPRFTEKQLKHFQRIFERDGAGAQERSRKSITAKLLETERKIQKYKGSGGFTSSLERELRTFRGDLDAIDTVLKGEF